MSAQAKLKCPLCGAIKHIDVSELNNQAPQCDNDLMDMMMVEVSS